jgi:uncharacterized protein with GYD domain
MPRYIALANMTDRGLQTIKDAEPRLRGLERLAGQHQVQIVDFYLTLGGYDYVAIFEAPDDAAIGRFLLAAAANGNARTTTLRAFDRDEYLGLVRSLG